MEKFILKNLISVCAWVCVSVWVHECVLMCECVSSKLEWQTKRPENIPDRRADMLMCWWACWWLCWWHCVVCWCANDVLMTVLMYGCVDLLMIVLVCWCIDVCVDVLIAVIVDALMCWCVDGSMFRCHCVDVLMGWMRYCVDVLRCCEWWLVKFSTRKEKLLHSRQEKKHIHFENCF